MHLVDAACGVMGASAVVGTPIANAVGYALALQRLHPGRIVACFFGDGATEEGVFYEALSFAALRRLPILFVCENNRYAIHTHQSRRQPRLNIRERAAVFGVPAVEIGDDVLAIRDAVSGAAAALRRGADGPFFFECFTYRWKEHVGPNEDWNLGYRSAQEAAPWIAADQVRRLAALVAEPERRAIEAEVEREIAEAFAFAEASPFPEPAALHQDLYR
jgi:TPP-dependent pyruvate/acetoin dehydrogenase alpha subunit